MENLSSELTLIDSGRLASENLDELIKDLGIADLNPDHVFFWRNAPVWVKRTFTYLHKGNGSFVSFLFSLSPTFITLFLGIFLTMVLDPQLAITVTLFCLATGMLLMLPSTIFLNAGERATKIFARTATYKRQAIFKHCHGLVKNYEKELLDPATGQFPSIRSDIELKLHQASSLVSRFEANLKKCSEDDSLRRQELQKGLDRASKTFETLVDEQERIDRRTEIVKTFLISMERKVDDMDIDYAISDSLESLTELEQGSAQSIVNSNKRFYELATSLTEDIRKLNEAFGYQSQSFGRFELTAMPGDSEFDLLSASLASEQVNQTARELILSGS